MMRFERGLMGEPLDCFVFEAHKLIWGSDEILISSAHQVGRVIFADIPEAEKKLILGDNARRLFGV